MQRTEKKNVHIMHITSFIRQLASSNIQNIVDHFKTIK